MKRRSSARGPVQSVPVAVIGGSGLYDLPDIRDVTEVRVRTPFGSPSDAIVIGTLSGVRCAFLPRHGRGHRLLPSEIPARANFYALKSLGVERVLGIGAVGSLKEEVAPRHFLVPDQVVDRTHGRPSTFFGDGIVAHVSVDQPFCAPLSDLLVRSARDIGVTVHVGGTYVCIPGPAFSTKAESHVNRAQGFSVVGMTLAPEYKLAREAELCYASVSLVTDYDVWKEGEEVSGQKVLETLTANVNNVKTLVRRVLPQMVGPRPCACAHALRHAVFTAPAAQRADTRRRLELLLRPRP